MADRKCVKLKVNMYEDTKFKIIDRKPERDLIHYVWIRFVTLAGTVNLEGNLYMSKNIPYTIETLAIEFNRDINQIKLALDVFMELEMIEITEHNIYMVKNFAKHQNIKVKEMSKTKEKKDNINIEEVEIKENFKNEIDDNIKEETKNKKHENEVINKIQNTETSKIQNNDTSKRNHKDGKNINDTICDGKINIDFKTNVPILLEEKKNKKAVKSKSQKKNDKNTDNIDEIIMDVGNEDDNLIHFYNGDEARQMQENECVVEAWSF